MGITIISLILTMVVIYLYNNRRDYNRVYLLIALFISLVILPSKLLAMVLIYIVCFIIIKLGIESYRETKSLY